MKNLARIILGTSVFLGSLMVYTTEAKSMNMYNDYDEQAYLAMVSSQDQAGDQGFNLDAYTLLRESPRRQITKASMTDYITPGEYAIFAGCDEQCQEVKLTVTDASGKQLASAKGVQSAYIMIDEVSTKSQPYKVEMSFKCNTKQERGGTGLMYTMVEACYTHSEILQKK